MSNGVEDMGYRVILTNPNLSSKENAKRLYDQFVRKLPLEVLEEFEMLVAHCPPSRQVRGSCYDTSSLDDLED
jgi:hypothetical protein